jgi:hypothetical protein
VQHNGRVQARQCMHLLVAHINPSAASQLLAGQYLRAALRSSSSAGSGTPCLASSGRQQYNGSWVYWSKAAPEASAELSTKILRALGHRSLHSSVSASGLPSDKYH